MNKRWVLFHLNDALEHLQRLIAALQTGSVTREEFEIALEHAYHHLNVAWNSRSITDDEAAHHSDTDFVTWRKFPRNLNL